jgi:hypothetical protein
MIALPLNIVDVDLCRQRDDLFVINGTPKITPATQSNSMKGKTRKQRGRRP